MDKINIKELGGFKVYFTEADDLGQSLYAIHKSDLTLKLKLWLLLSDHIMLAGSHIFESDLTADILKENPLLLETGVIVPDMRDECGDFLDFVRLKQEEGDPGFQKDSRKLMEMAEFLNNHTRQTVLWTAQSVRGAFRDTLVKDLLDKDSVLRRKLIGVDIDSFQKLTWELGNTASLSRKLISDLAKRYLGRKEAILIKYANILYYLWGAAHLESEPALHYEPFTWGRDKIITSTKALVRTDELPLFQTTLDEFGISNEVLSKLTIPVILELRKEEIAKRFRAKWHRLIEQARISGKISDDLVELQNLEGKIMEVIREAVGEEKRKRKRLQEGKKWLSIGSFITSVITSFVNNPAIGLATLLIELSAIDPFLSALERKFGGTEISLLSTRLQDLASEA